jgi:hypothetical protein
MEWSQINTPTMDAPTAACIMGVPVYVAENKLKAMRQEASIANVVETNVCKVLGSRYPLDDLKKFGIRNVPFAEIGYANERSSTEWYAGR